MAKNISLLILLVEDNQDDAVLMREYVRDININNSSGYFDLLCTENIKETIELLKEKKPDIIILDLDLPDSSGIKTLIKIQVFMKEIPVIILTGNVDEAVGIESIKLGAQDFLIKNKILPELLNKSIRYAIERFSILKEKEYLIKKLEDSVLKVKTLSGLIPICANCKKIRNDKGYWELLENYLHSHSDADFTHGLCPECEKILYEDLKAKNK